MGRRGWVWVLAVSAVFLPLSAGHGAAPPRLDRQGYPLPPGTVARLGRLNFRHGSPVGALAFSPDGKTLATGGEHLRLRFWDLSTGQQLPHPTPEGSALALAFSPDGALLASGGNGGRLRLWD